MNDYQISGYRLMVDCSSSKWSVSVRIRLAIELVILNGKVFPCRGKRCRIEAGLARKGKVAIGKAGYLLNIVYFSHRCSNHLFSVFIYEKSIFNLYWCEIFIIKNKNYIYCEEYSLIGKTRSFKLLVLSSNLSALELYWVL
jgi:hypothetical protein